MTVCGIAQQSMDQLLLFGIPQVRSTSQLFSEQLTQARRNAVRFQVQNSRVLPFAIHCMARTHSLLETALAAQQTEGQFPRTPDGAASMRDGVLGMFARVLSAIEPSDEIPAPSPALRKAVIQAIADTAPAYARVLPLAQRALIAGQLNAVLARASTEEKALLLPAVAAFDSTDCAGFCRL